MKEISTKYGKIKGVTNVERYTRGVLKECKLTEFCQIETIHGNFIPQYDEAEVRRKYKRSVSFYENGNLQSISFQKQTVIDTSIGKLPAELALFYEDESIKRIFPVNGKITAYWTEENEYKLAKEMEFEFKFGSFKKRIICISFYKSGAIKSLTLWPKDFINISSLYGIIEARIGVSLYQNGAIKSCEPRMPIYINTIIGELHAYDLGANGINGDINSLNFNEDGTVKTLCTSADKITITGIDGKVNIIEPKLHPNNFNIEIMDLAPLNIEFYIDKIKIDDNEYNLKDNIFHVDKYSRKPFIINNKSSE